MNFSAMAALLLTSQITSGCIEMNTKNALLIANGTLGNALKHQVAKVL